MDTLPHTRDAPDAKVMVDSRPRRKLVGQEAPGTATAQDIAEAVENLAHLYAARTTTGFGCWNQGLKDSPFAVGEITAVGEAS